MVSLHLAARRFAGWSRLPVLRAGARSEHCNAEMFPGCGRQPASRWFFFAVSPGVGVMSSLESGGQSQKRGGVSF